MIVTHSTFAGFCIMIGSWGIHLGCFLSILFVVPRYDTKSPDTDEQGFSARGVLRYLMFMHFCCAFAAFINQPKITFLENRSKYAFSIICIVLYIFGLTEVCMELNQQPDVSESIPLDQAQMILWLMIELYILVGLLAANVLYLFVRSFLRQSVQLDIVEPEDRLNRMDSVRANNVALQCWMNFWVFSLYSMALTIWLTSKISPLIQ